MVRDMVSFDLDFCSRVKSEESGYHGPAAAAVPLADAARDALQPAAGNL
jgi:hypothetical protein